MLRVMQPLMPSADEILPYLRRIDETRIYSNSGPLHDELVDRLSKYFSVSSEQIVIMSNATIALQAAVELLANNWVEVPMPSWTFTATAAAVVSAGMKPKFLDIDADWRAVFNPAAPFLLDVLPFGNGLRMTKGLNSKMVIDGAASFDALKGCGEVLQDNSILVLSMHATKLIGAGEGGICIVKNIEWARSLRSWSNFGFKPSSRLSDTNGTNSKLSEYACAVALASLDNWPETRERLIRVRNKAFQISTGFSFKLAPPMSDKYITPYWIIEFKTANEKERAVKILGELDIESRDWWAMGCHKMPAYSKFEREILEKTDDAAARSLGLPFHAYLTDQDFERLEKAFRSL